VCHRPGGASRPASRRRWSGSFVGIDVGKSFLDAAAAPAAAALPRRVPHAAAGVARRAAALTALAPTLVGLAATGV
jgi:hypothetical protein